MLQDHAVRSGCRSFALMHLSRNSSFEWSEFGGSPYVSTQIGRQDFPSVLSHGDVGWFGMGDGKSRQLTVP